jgi:hypothetical protein
LTSLFVELFYFYPTLIHNLYRLMVGVGRTSDSSRIGRRHPSELYSALSLQIHHPTRTFLHQSNVFLGDAWIQVRRSLRGVTGGSLLLQTRFKSERELLGLTASLLEAPDGRGYMIRQTCELRARPAGSCREADALTDRALALADRVAVCAALVAACISFAVKLSSSGAAVVQPSSDCRSADTIGSSTSLFLSPGLCLPTAAVPSA